MKRKNIAGIELLPIAKDVETKDILNQVALSERALAELKGVVQKMPNESVLLNTLFLQEAKASSEIENIITTHDEVFKSSIGDFVSKNAKEVKRYNDALYHGFRIVKNNEFLRNKNIKEIQEILENNRAGFRKQAGTTLKNNRGEIIYTPPQNPQDIEDLMKNTSILRLFVL